MDLRVACHPGRSAVCGLKLPATLGKELEMIGCPDCGSRLRKRVVDRTQGFDRNESDARDYFWQCTNRRCEKKYEQHKIDKLMEDDA